MSDKVLEKKYNKTEADNLLSNKLSVNGGTINGNLSQKSNTIDVIKSDNGISSTVSFLYSRTDKNDLPFAYYDTYVRKDGTVSTGFRINNYDTAGTRLGPFGLTITVEKDGTGKWEISAPDSFRTAIGAAPKNSLEDANNPSKYPKLGIQWTQQYSTYDWICVWADFNGFNKVIAPITPSNFKKVLSSKLPTIKKIFKNVGSVTVTTGGYTDISSSIPTTPTGYTFLFALINNWKSITNNNMISLSSNGMYLMAPNGTTVENLRIDYFYILTEDIIDAS